MSEAASTGARVATASERSSSLMRATRSFSSPSMVASSSSTAAIMRTSF
jgi:hypothetical protein